MTGRTLNVLVVGATGSIGRLVVDEALRRGQRRCATRRSLTTCPRKRNASSVI